MEMADYTVYKCLWTKLNEVVCPPGRKGGSCLLLEMPGYSVNPDIFDIELFRANSNAEMSPSFATAMLVDRIPALAPCFYDTGFSVSSYWKQLIETFTVPNEQNNADLKEKYDEAIETLYGGTNGCKNLQTSERFKSLDALRDEWYAAKVDLKQQHEELYYKEKVDDAFLEYTSMKSQINLHQAAIFEYTRRDPNHLPLKQRQSKPVIRIFGGSVFQKACILFQGRIQDLSEGGYSMRANFKPRPLCSLTTPISR